MKLHKRIYRLTFLCLLSTFILLFMPTTNNVGQAKVSNNNKSLGTYQTVIEVEDWGAVTTKVIVDLGQKVSKGKVDVDTFDVHVERNDARLSEPLLEEGYRTVTKAFISDEEGNPVDNGRYATLELEIGPDISLSSALNYTKGANEWIDYAYTITQTQDIETDSSTISGLVIDTLAGETRQLIDQFSFGNKSYDGTTLTYADFTPKKGDKKQPLIIWLHGGGEGGTDPSIPLAANKAVSFITDEAQSIYGGAYVLVPQTPTRWMEGYEGNADGTSIYEDALMSLIKDYVADNPNIDPNRIYLGGASNGGYLTMLMVRDYPNYFAAGFPVAQGLSDELISDDDLVNISKTPLWFVHAKNDTTLNPNMNTIPTFKRLEDLGADVYLSLFDDVRDTSGLYVNEDGTPYQYDGHWSWIYTYNNEATAEVNEEQTTIMEWMAKQSNTLETEEDPKEDPKEQPEDDPKEDKPEGENPKGQDSKDDNLGAEKPSDKTGERLPNTATTIFNWMLAGALLLVVGGCALYFGRKKIRE